jgi:hypothetical protein
MKTPKVMAKPHQLNTLGMQEFDTVKQAVKYLNSEPNISYDMPTMPLNDLVMLGKIYMSDGSPVPGSNIIEISGGV